jgi:hypothetical protein
MAILIRALKEGEESLANDFFNRIYSSDRSLTHFRWEFLEGPFGKAIYVIAIDDEFTDETKVVGIQCAIPMEILHPSGRKVLTAKSEDTLVDPAYRGKKIFERMYQLLFEECKNAGIKYIWGFTPAEKAFSRLGFDVPFKTQQALKVFGIASAYAHLSKLNPENKTIQKLKILGLCVLSWAKQLVSFSGTKGYSVETAAFRELNKYFSEFLREYSVYNLNFTDSFVKWRLQDNPYKNSYSHLLIRKDRKFIASVVVNKRSGVSYIEQLCAETTETEVAIAVASNFLKKQGAPFVRVLCFDHNDVVKNINAALEKAGFTTLARGNYFVWKDLFETKEIKPEELFLTRLFTQGNL